MYTTSDFMIPFSIFHCWVPNLWCQILLRNAESSEVVLSSSRADTKVWQAHIYFWNIKKRLTLQFTLQFFNSYHKLLPGENPPSSDPISIQSPIPSISKPQSSPHGSDPSSVKGWKDSNLTSRVKPPGWLAKPGWNTTQNRPMIDLRPRFPKILGRFSIWETKSLHQKCSEYSEIFFDIHGWWP